LTIKKSHRFAVCLFYAGLLSNPCGLCAAGIFVCASGITCVIPVGVFDNQKIPPLRGLSFLCRLSFKALRALRSGSICLRSGITCVIPVGVFDNQKIPTASRFVFFMQACFQIPAGFAQREYLFAQRDYS
jgi:hypothetical protein